MSSILGKSILRLGKGLIGVWLLVIVVLPYGLMSGSPTTGAFLSGCLLIALIGLVAWDYKKGAAKIYPLILDGLILFGVAVSAGAIGGLLAAFFSYRFSFPWWIGPLIGFIWFALLETRKASAEAKAKS